MTGGEGAAGGFAYGRGSSAQVPFRDRKLETAPRAVIEWMQLEGLKTQVANALKTDFYRDRFVKAGISSPDFIKTLDDIRKLCAVEDEGIAGTIAGRAVYDGSLDFAAAQKLADELGKK